MRRAVRIPWPVRSRRRRARDIRTPAVAAVKQTEGVEPVERAGVIVEMRRLTTHRSLPLKTQPREVLIDRRFESGARPNRINIFDPQQESPATRTRETVVQQRGIGVTEVQKTVRRGREAENSRRCRTHAEDPEGSG